MGFPCISLKIPKCLSITLVLINLVSWFKTMLLNVLMPILNRLGLLKPQEQQPERPPDDYVLMMDGLTLVTVPVKTLTSVIKKKLPVVEYGLYLLRRSECMEEEENMVCSVCLDGLERSQVIRELSNCSHVFHQHCLDAWVDEGQVTCPLCRSMLFPAKGLSLKHLHHHHHHE